MGDFENRFSPGSFGWGNCNHLLCVCSLLAFSYDGDIDRYTTWICYQGVLQKMKNTFVKVQVYFDIILKFITMIQYY